MSKTYQLGKYFYKTPLNCEKLIKMIAKNLISEFYYIYFYFSWGFLQHISPFGKQLISIWFPDWTHHAAGFGVPSFIGYVKNMLITTVVWNFCYSNW